MSEKLPEHTVLRFTSKEERLAAMEDSEVLNHFLAELRHPSGAGHLAEKILVYAGTKSSENLSDERRAWRDRMVTIRFSIGYSDNDWDKLIDQHDEEYDAGFAAIVSALQDTRDSKDLSDERKALQVLLDLRVAAINRGLQDTKDWQLLAKKLTSV